MCPLSNPPVLAPRLVRCCYRLAAWTRKWELCSSGCPRQAVVARTRNWEFCSHGCPHNLAVIAKMAVRSMVAEGAWDASGYSVALRTWPCVVSRPSQERRSFPGEYHSGWAGEEYHLTWARSTTSPGPTLVSNTWETWDGLGTHGRTIQLAFASLLHVGFYPK